MSRKENGKLPNRQIKTWVWVVGGVAVLAIVAFLTFIGLGLYVSLNNVRVTPASAASAEHEFATMLERFKGRDPLLLIDEDGQMKSSVDPRIEAGSSRQGPRLESLHVMAWDPDEDKLIRVKVPFWVLRLTHHGARMKFGADEINLENLHITVEDLERHGPGLILDHRDRRGVRVLLWAE